MSVIAPSLAPGVASVAPRAATRREEIPALTGLRFVAAFSVLMAHGVFTILGNYETPTGAVFWLKQASGFGMTLFFVLSGFVIHYNYADLIVKGRLRGTGTFLWARFARLYPLYLLMMVVFILVSSRHIDLWRGHPERFGSTLQALPYFLFSVQSWIYKVIDGNALVSAIGGASPLTWSISTEWFFYLAYPVIVWPILRARTPWLTVAAIVVWCALWVLLSSGLYDRTPQIDAWAIERFGPTAGVEDHLQDSFIRWLLYISPYLRIGEFILGALVAQLFIQLHPWKTTSAGNVVGFIVFLIAAASILPITFLDYSPDIPTNIFRRLNMNFALAPTAALLIFCAARYRSPASRLLTWAPFIALGDASYSIYMVHPVVLTIAVRLGGSATHGIVYDLVELILLVSLVCAISLMLFAYYEAPARKLLRQFWRDRRSTAQRQEATESLAS
jgi:peptidoglycan/LPS O-acetylase OafA/YrhL